MQHHISKSNLKQFYTFIYCLQDDDPITDKLFDSSEEGKKVTRNNGEKYLSFFRRINAPTDKG